MNILLIVLILFIIYTVNPINLVYTIDYNVMMFALTLGFAAYLLLRDNDLVFPYVLATIYLSYTLLVNYYKQE